MKKQKTVLELAFSSMFLALALVLPFFTAQIPQINSKLCPMHIPVLLCGYVCGGTWGLAVGAVAPLLRSFMFSTPVLFPTAFSMAFELAVYGFVSGTLYRILPKRRLNNYLSLVLAMISGRLVSGVVQFCCMGLDATKFSLSTFWAGTFVNTVPGIIIQLIIIPVIVSAIANTKKFKSLI